MQTFRAPLTERVADTDVLIEKCRTQLRWAHAGGSASPLWSQGGGGGGMSE